MSYGMTPADIRKLLLGYLSDGLTIYNITGDTAITQDVITNVSSTSNLRPYQFISGPGIPAGAYITIVGANTINISSPATATGTTVALAVSTYCQIDDEWIINTRDTEIIPWVENKTRISISGGVQTVTEYHSGTASSIIILDRKPVVQLLSINLITNPQNWVYVSPSSCEIIGAEGIIKLRAVLESWQAYVPAFPRGKYNLRIQYTYGYATVPDFVYRAINLLVASRLLGHLGARTGGGSLSVQGYSKSFGSRGKYHDVRQDMDRMALALLRPLMTGTQGG